MIQSHGEDVSYAEDWGEEEDARAEHLEAFQLYCQMEGIDFDPEDILRCSLPEEGPEGATSEASIPEPAQIDSKLAALRKEMASKPLQVTAPKAEPKSSLHARAERTVAALSNAAQDEEDVEEEAAEEEELLGSLLYHFFPFFLSSSQFSFPNIGG